MGKLQIINIKSIKVFFKENITGTNIEKNIFHFNLKKSKQSYFLFFPKLLKIDIGKKELEIKRGKISDNNTIIVINEKEYEFIITAKNNFYISTYKSLEPYYNDKKNFISSFKSDQKSILTVRGETKTILSKSLFLLIHKETFEEIYRNDYELIN